MPRTFIPPVFLDRGFIYRVSLPEPNFSFILRIKDFSSVCLRSRERQASGIELLQKLFFFRPWIRYLSDLRGFVGPIQNILEVMTGRAIYFLADLVLVSFNLAFLMKEGAYGFLSIAINFLFSSQGPRCLFCASQSSSGVSKRYFQKKWLEVIIEFYECLGNKIKGISHFQANMIQKKKGHLEEWWYSQYNIQLQLIMQKTKVSAQTGTSSIRPITVASNYKNQKVETLNQIVQEIAQPKKQTIETETETAPASLPESRNGMGEQVLKVLKHRIKTNYDHLYSNYPENKAKIFKQIQTVQHNINGENSMNHKQQQVIKQKSKYDKAKTLVEEKQRKLKKLVQLRTQLKQTNENDNSEGNKEQREKLQLLEFKKEEIDHNNLIYAEMLKERKAILLTLDKRYKKMSEELEATKEKTQKWHIHNKKKKNEMKKLDQKLSKEQEIEIPAGLAQSLSNKLQQYENKHSYNNIIHHEAILQEQKFQQLKQETTQRKEEQRLSKMRKDKEEKLELQKLHHINALNNMQQYQIKRLYGAQSIEQVLECDAQKDSANLEILNKQIQEEIALFEQKNQLLQQQIQALVANQKCSEIIPSSTDQLKQKLEEEKNRKNIRKDQLKKKQDLANHWQTIMHIINNNQHSTQALDEFTMKALNRQEEEGGLGKSSNVKPQTSCRSSQAISFVDFQ